MSELNISPTGITFVKFGAVWCKPCEMLDKSFDTFHDNENIHIVKYDIDVDAELTESEKISTVPTVKYYLDGTYIGKFVGAVPASFIQSVIDGKKQLEK